jgi:Ca2+:H+ antiporter
MNRWLYALLLAVPAALIAEGAHAPPLAVFLLAALGLVPLAGLIGTATEALAERVSPKVGGLLNATFGNAAEIIIGLTALAAGLTDVVRASIAGSIIGNSLLVLGTAMLAGGWRYGRQLFDARTAGHYASMLALVVVGMAIPSLLATIGEGGRPGAQIIRGLELHELSLGVAVILLVCYVAYIAFSIFGVRAGPRQHILEVHSGEDREDTAELAPLPHDSVRQPRAHGAVGAVREPERDKGKPHRRRERDSQALMARLERAWETNIWLPVALLAGVTALTAVVSEALVGAIEPVTEEVGLSPFFVGLIVLPIVGNAAEHFTAITMAMRNHMEVAMAITAGSSIQIALLVAPVLVFAGAIMGQPLDLNFTLLEVAIFGLVAGLYALISLDGESTWLEGLLLLAFYAILAIGTFFTPA